VLFVYGSEKQDWIDAVTPAFNGGHHRLPDGKVVHVSTKPMGSGESKDDILAGRVQADVWSPASGAFVTLANAESARTGGPLVGRTQNLVLSPVVIAMWKPMAVALGWPAKPIGWADVGDLAAEPDAWGARGMPQFGRFKFGHTHPEYSNSGLIAVLAEAYAAAGKTRGLTLADLARPDVAERVHRIEHAVVHYGRSTGFFGKRLADFGPGYLSAAVLYENMVVTANADRVNPPLVAIYPKEGTIWSDHPAAVVERPWVTADQRAGGQMYLDYLRAPAQQQRALAFGFRPAEGDVGAPIDAEHGVDPKQPSTILDAPGADVVNAAVELWRREKKPSNVALVFDTSGSMADEHKLQSAQAGAKALVAQMDPRDTVTLVPFSSEVHVGRPMAVGADRAALNGAIDALFADGNTNLYQAIQMADDAVTRSADGQHIDAVVVLTDGEDNGTAVTLEMLLNQLRREGEGGSGVRVFTIGYGHDAALDALRSIAHAAHGEFYAGTPDNIIDVFRDVATFF
jgi:Ca-activated chloride channel family protein